MQLQAFHVSGFRSLAEIETVPLRAPTIITGPNDGGKTALIHAVRFLLNGPTPPDEDRTWARDGETPRGGVAEDRRFGEMCVTGRFSLSPQEQKALELPEEIDVRRRLGVVVTATYEIKVEVPEDERLRALDDSLTLSELKSRANGLAVEPEGPANRKASFLEPLQEMAAEAAKVTAWMTPGRELLDRLPRMLEFSSSEAPDPEAEIRASLLSVYQNLLADDELLGPVRSVEDQVRQQLEAEAAALRDHIRMRCPELSDIQIHPSVSFASGFGGVTMLSARGGDAGVELRAAGAGRRRRITLAVWEWTTKLLGERGSDDPPVVVAYDEPDTHLDYGHQRELVDLIHQQAALPGTRILVATHSLNLIDKVNIEDVVHVGLEDGRTVIRQLAGGGHAEIDRYLADLAAAMGLRNSVLLHERCFVAVEGATEAQALPLLFRVATGLPLQGAGIALIAASGNDGALKVARFLNDHGRKIQFVVDRDSATEAGRRKVFRPEALSAQGIREDQMHLVGSPNELEDLFGDEQWAETANDTWPRVDGVTWTPEDFGALRSEGRFSKDLEKMVREASEEAPSSKVGYLATLSQRLREPEEVPAQLREVFEALIAMGEGDRE